MKKFLYEADTIAAIATPVGSSGIGIIRISGPKSLDVVEKLFFKRNRLSQDLSVCNLRSSPSHYLHYGFICEPHSQIVIDEVLLAIMRAPHSYTKEDVVEIQSHGGPAIMTTIMNKVLETGARLALPGEFTKRAFLNGRIDLSQAESIVEMVSAKSEAGLKISAGQLAGNLKNIVQHMIKQIQNILVHFEAAIEFAEEVETSSSPEEWISVIEKKIVIPTQEILKNYHEGHFFRDGVRLGIIGRPNVGKSSLLNYLLKKERAIVTPIPGTTRDIIEEPFTIGGLPVIIIDTAGLHPTNDPVEIIGIQKTQESIDSADIVLFMVDGGQPFIADDFKAYQKIANKKIILVINKLDLIEGEGSIKVETLYAKHPIVFISAKYGYGVEKLKEIIKNIAVGNVNIEPGKNIIPNLRQKMALDIILETAQEVIKNIQSSIGEEFIINDMKRINAELKKIIGDYGDDDILDAIFSRFCIGK